MAKIIIMNTHNLICEIAELFIIEAIYLYIYVHTTYLFKHHVNCRPKLYLIFIFFIMVRRYLPMRLC